MSISENIAKYRKKKGCTQEQLGEMLGVTNQAVSKWESAVSMPDIMLLPKIADALGITLEELYGIEKRENGKVKADDFPKAANDLLTKYFVDQSRIRFRYAVSQEDNLREIQNSIEKGRILMCISDTAGAVQISNDFSFIDTEYKAPDSGNIFGTKEIASAMKKLSDSHVRKVLAYMYEKSFSENITENKSFFISDISENCRLSEDDTFEAVEKLTALCMLETYTNDDHVTEYIFLKSRAVYALAAFKVVERLIKESYVWEIVRDTSVIDDYAFEKLWRQ